MKREYDFSGGTRGKFHRPNAVLHIPVYLEPEVQQRLERVAEARKSDVAAVANELLKSNIRLAESMAAPAPKTGADGRSRRRRQ
jgi:hypothetical protein